MKSFAGKRVLVNGAGGFISGSINQLAELVSLSARM